MNGTTDILADYPNLSADVVPIDDYAEIKELLAHPAAVQAAYGGETAELMHGVLNFLDGPEHLKRRRLMAPLLSRTALAAHKDETLVEVIDLSLEEIGVGVSDRLVRADLVQMVWRMLHRLAARVAGIDGLSTAAEADRFIGLVKTFGESLTLEWSVDRDKAAMRDAGIAAREAIRDEFYGPSYTRRRAEVERFRDGEIDKDDLGLDLVTLMELHREPEWDEELALREVCVFLMAATQTTSHSFPQFVVRFEEWMSSQSQARDELIADDVVLRDAIFESLRLFVASPARLRRMTQDVTLSTGRELREGDTAALFFRPASEEYDGFGDRPDTYDPTRDGGNTAAWGLAFGAGPHACIGRPLVVGSKQGGYLDGTMMTLARALYSAGLRLDPDRPVVYEQFTTYDMLAEVPVIFDGRSQA